MIKLDSTFHPIHIFIGLAMSWKNIGLDVPSRPIFSSTHGLTNKSVYWIQWIQFYNKLLPYRDTTCPVKSELSLLSWFKIITAVRHGDIWFLPLFRLDIDLVNDKRGLTLVPRRSSRYPEVKLAHLDHADDIALFEKKVRKTTGKSGLKMSYKKKEIIFIRQASKANLIVPLGNEGLIKVVDHFKYLGAFCSMGPTSKGRIGKASGAFRVRQGVER